MLVKYVFIFLAEKKKERKGGKNEKKEKGKRKRRIFPNLFQVCYSNNNGAGI